eukprot:CAMPEP_0201595080 /NCGR_PEP_ID=MMETSP0190_2-20130828/192205_1 /ASSEMBLY_ACC=CAM_ASM_000263 /TAXON_ID=37353 /ORGANISM="Rosalina sp." /LENGTH=344 /DNA_ID=CAMNT_0048054949 /DNA_START=190 /DNA_END=1223 /DNA_ORIENTATION=-
MACLDWIDELITSSQTAKETVCPFQVDLAIAVGQPASTEKKTNMGGIIQNDDDDDDDDDDDEDDQKGGGGGGKKYKGYVDVVGDLEKKLKANNLKYVTSEHESKTGAPKTRFYAQMIKDLKGKLDKTTYPSIGDKTLQYPHRSRFVTMIDRRKKGKKDNVFMYTAPADCRDIPKDFVPEWFVSASKSTIVPDLEYGDGQNALKSPEWFVSASKSTIVPDLEYGDGQNALKDANSDKAKTDETKEKLEKANIGSGFHAKGGLLTISFIVEEADRIKAYLYYNGQMHYLKPEDIKSVFVKLYNMDSGMYGPKNKEFIAKRADAAVLQMNKRLKDKYLKYFQEQYTV